MSGGVGEGGLEPPTSCSQSRCATTAPLPVRKTLAGRVTRTLLALRSARAHRSETEELTRRDSTHFGEGSVVGITGTARASVGNLSDFSASFRLSLRALNRSPRTVDLKAMNQFIDFVQATGMPTGAAGRS